jgi:hypothetical protein
MKDPVLVVRQEGELWKWCYRYDGRRAPQTHLPSSESFPTPDGAASAARSAYPDLPVVDEHGVPFAVSPRHVAHDHRRLLLLACAAAVVAWWLVRRRRRPA